MFSSASDRAVRARRHKQAAEHNTRRGQAGYGRTLRIEGLEHRNLLSLTISGYATPDYVAYVAPNGATPLATTGPTGYTPAQIRAAYGINQITFNNGTVAGDGSGTTIAIVDAYNDPNIANDLHQFDLAVRPGRPDVHHGEPDRRHVACRRPTPAGPRKSRWTWNGPTPSPRGPTSCWSRPTAPRTATC